MSRRLPALTARQVIRALERGGFVVERSSGSHHLLVHKGDPGRRVTGGKYEIRVRPSMRQIHARPLCREGFAPFGDVLEAPAEGGRSYFDGGLGNARPQASPSLSLTLASPLAGLPLVAEVMERHAFSSQSFIPLAIGRWLVIVAPSADGGGPDPSAAQAFLAGPGQGITYHVGTWHHPLTVLDRPAVLAVFMWRDGTAGDEEFVPVEPFLVAVPSP